MLLSENLRQAFNSLLLNKKRTVLTMIGIIIGLSSVLSIVSIGDTLSKVVENFFTQYVAGGNIMSFVSGYDKETRTWLEGDYTFSMDDVYDFIDSTDGIILDIDSSVRGELTGSVRIDNDHKADVKLVGTSSAYDITQKLRILNGRYITRDECRYEKPVAVISDIAAKACFGSCSEAIGKMIDYQGEYVSSEWNEETYEIEYGDPVKVSSNLVVVGVYEYVAPTGEISLMAGETKETDLMCPVSFCNSRILSQPASDERLMASFIIKDKESCVKAKELIDDFAMSLYGDDDDYIYSVLNTADDLDVITNIISIVTGAFVLIAAISLLVGGIGLMNTMLVSVTERTKEIGIKKALGARNSSIRIQFLFESAVLCLVACSIGIFFGMLFGMIVESNFDRLVALVPNESLKYFLLNSEIHVTPSLNAVIISTLFSLGVGLIFGYYPANKGAKMQPVEALRYE